MKLNPDCIRDILLAVEESSDSSRAFRYGKSSPVPGQLGKYAHNEIWYHMRQCNASGLFMGFTASDNGNLVIIRDLDPKGHEFLAHIRQDTKWERIKETGKKLGVNSLPTLIQLAVDALRTLL